MGMFSAPDTAGHPKLIESRCKDSASRIQWQKNTVFFAIVEAQPIFAEGNNSAR
jgi:hypothetical protein